jgi:formyltetrahydrofolate synthetase
VVAVSLKKKAGSIETLPGLPTRPRALDMDVASDGEIIGLS